MKQEPKTVRNHQISENGAGRDPLAAAQRQLLPPQRQELISSAISAFAPKFMFHKFLAGIPTNGRLVRNLGLHENAEFKNPLEFFVQIMPSVIITNCMGWKIVIYSVLAAPTTGKNVIRLPIITSEHSAAHMAPVASFL